MSQKNKLRRYPNPFVFRAEGFLHRCSALGLKSQLLERHVVEIRPVPFAASGLAINNNDQFVIYVDTRQPITKQAETIGAAIAETFLYNFTYPLAQQAIDKRWKKMAETYCRSYAERWRESIKLTQVKPVLRK